MKRFIILLTLSIAFARIAFSEDKLNPPPLNSEVIRLGALDTFKLLDYEIAGATGFVTYLGLKSWNWGSSKAFRFNNEGWFGYDTGSGGHDKLGHFFSSYLISEFFYHSLDRKVKSNQIKSYYPGLYSWLIMLYVEIFDGYSDDHGFSYEDLISNSAGIGFAMLRNFYPEIRNLLDFRLEYSPRRFLATKHPITDYMEQRYLVVFKGTGIPVLEKNWGRYLEFNFGYYARGFKSKDKIRTRDVFVGLGVNLDELLFKPLSKELKYGRAPKYLFDYFQLPNSYLRASVYDDQQP